MESAVRHLESGDLREAYKAFEELERTTGDPAVVASVETEAGADDLPGLPLSAELAPLYPGLKTPSSSRRTLPHRSARPGLWVTTIAVVP